jgi:hypothetical protein
MAAMALRLRLPVLWASGRMAAWVPPKPSRQRGHPPSLARHRATRGGKSLTPVKWTPQTRLIAIGAFWGVTDLPQSAAARRLEFLQMPRPFLPHLLQLDRRSGLFARMVVLYGTSCMVESYGTSLSAFGSYCPDRAPCFRRSPPHNRAEGIEVWLSELTSGIVVSELTWLITWVLAHACFPFRNQHHVFGSCTCDAKRQI